jgi:uncharacterized RDD family membrane protein YckC
VLAFCIDSFILGLVGYVLGLFFSAFFQRLGKWGPLLDFAISLPYFGLLNSSVGHGQTLGKRLMQIRVVNGDGNPISPRAGTIRYVIFAAPWFLSVNMFPTVVSNSWVGTGLEALLVGWMIVTIYLYVFNRTTRQTLQDLVVRTYVVESGATIRVEVPGLWAGHLYIAAAMVLAFVLGAPVVSQKFAERGPFPELLSIQRAVQRADNVRDASVLLNRQLGRDGSVSLIVTVDWKQNARPVSVTGRISVMRCLPLQALQSVSSLVASS